MSTHETAQAAHEAALEEIRVLTALRFEQALKAGVTFTWADYKALSPLERGCLLAANQRVEVERALRAGLASSGIQGFAEVMSLLDGGEFKRTLQEKLDEQKVVEQLRAAAAKAASKRMGAGGVA